MSISMATLCLARGADGDHVGSARRRRWWRQPGSFPLDNSWRTALDGRIFLCDASGQSCAGASAVLTKATTHPESRAGSLSAHDCLHSIVTLLSDTALRLLNKGGRPALSSEFRATTAFAGRIAAVACRNGTARSSEKCVKHGKRAPQLAPAGITEEFVALLRAFQQSSGKPRIPRHYAPLRRTSQTRHALDPMQSRADAALLFGGLTEAFGMRPPRPAPPVA